MAHIHAQIDFVVSVFITNRYKQVLLVNHKKLDGWYAIGGHIELHETPDDALDREIFEETGLSSGRQVIVVNEGETPFRNGVWSRLRSNPHNSQQLRQPWAIEVHDFPPVQGHRHVALVYRAKSDMCAVKLEQEAHHDIRWFSSAELDDKTFNVPETIKWYGHRAILLDTHNGEVAQPRSSQLHEFQSDD